MSPWHFAKGIEALLSIQNFVELLGRVISLDATYKIVETASRRKE